MFSAILPMYKTNLVWRKDMLLPNYTYIGDEEDLQYAGAPVRTVL